jgi:hypothetical protein
MGFLSDQEVTDLRGAAIGLYATGQRFAMFSGVPVSFIAALPVGPNPLAELLQDLAKMLPAGKPAPQILTNGAIPLLTWLKNGVDLSAGTEEGEPFGRVWKIAADRLAGLGAPPSAGDLPESKERVISAVDHRLDVAFFTRAVETAARVVRLSVPVFAGGQPDNNVNGPSFGTGWVIGRGGLVLTNAHVIRARDDNKTPLPDADLALQVAGTVVEFDVEPGKNAIANTVAALLKIDTRLDYALLQLAPGFEDRAPLPLRQDRLQVEGAGAGPDGKLYVPVNIIQHPDGGPKKAAFRDNLVTSVGDDAIRYFTDTEGGASGSPVCDDKWRVVALHRAHGQLAKVVNFQGKNVAVANIGTPMHAILENLRGDPVLFPQIEPRLVIV